MTITLNKQQLLAWTGFFIIILFEFLLFRNYLMNEIVPYFPKAYDQTVYLAHSYRLYENILDKGRIAKYLLQMNILPQTLLFHVQAAIFFLLFGASRYTALMINFIYLALLQYFSFTWLKEITGRYRYSFVFIGLLLTANTLLMANDFRIDFIACCLYGLLCCSIMRSNIFLSARYTFISFVISALLIMMRYITICYVLGVTGAIFAYYASRWMLASQDKLPEIRVRLKHLLVFTLGISFLAAFIVWLNYDLIYNYYIVGHVTGGEKLMRLKVALQGWHVSNAWFFYPAAFWQSHLSHSAMAQFAVILCIYLVMLCAIHFLSPERARVSQYKLNHFADLIVFLCISIIVPMFILSMDDSKSGLVISIILVPFIYLLQFMFFIVSEMLWTNTSSLANRALTTVSVLLIFSGLYNFTAHLSHERNHHYSDQRDPVVTQMVDSIGDYAQFMHINALNVASDFIDEHINAPIEPFYYERHGYLINVNTEPLGNNGMTAISKADAYQSLRDAQIYTTSLTDYTPDKIFPFEKSIQPFRHELQQYAAKNMISLGDFLIFDSRLRVYAKPDVRIKGIIENEVTDNGIWLELPSVAARQIKSIELQGSANLPDANHHAPTLQAEINLENSIIKVPAQFTYANHRYRILIALPAWHVAAPLVIHLTFHAAGTAAGQTYSKLMMKTPDIKNFILR